MTKRDEATGLGDVPVSDQGDGASGAVKARWVQPQTRTELLERLAAARDLRVSERERENLCACAFTGITRLASDNVTLLAALKGLMQRLDSHFGGPNSSNDWQEQEMARAAIAQAEAHE